MNLTNCAEIGDDPALMNHFQMLQELLHMNAIAEVLHGVVAIVTHLCMYEYMCKAWR